MLAEAPSVTLVCPRLQVSPGPEETAKATLPTKPLTDATVIVDVPGEPDVTVT